MEAPELDVGTYRHYKGKMYEVIGVGCYTESLEFFVIYRPLYEHEGQPDIWLRPYSMFVESVIHDGVTMPRFTKIDKVLFP